MNLSAPENLTWIIAVVLGVLGLLGQLCGPFRSLAAPASGCCRSSGSLRLAD